jgi:hypothetical protein
MRVWLDDIREIPEGFDIWAKNADFLLGLLISGNVTYISFDHDLGIDKTGYDVAKWIEEMAYSGFITPIQWDIHSANPVGRKNIQMAMEAAQRFWNLL